MVNITSTQNKVMKRLSLTIVVTALAAILTLVPGCKTGPTAEFKPGVNFSQYHTYALLPLPTAGPASDPGAPLKQAGSVVKAVSETLAAKGFTAAPIEQADLLVKLTTRFNQHDNEVWMSGSGRMIMEDRMLTIRIIENKTKDVVWSDWLNRTTYDTATPQEAGEIIAQMLKPFPPHSTASAATK
jgi:hypothetical protein